MGLYLVLLLEVYLDLLQNPSDLSAQERRDLMALDNPEWLLRLLRSTQAEVQAAALYVFAELASAGLVLDKGKFWAPFCQVEAILRDGEKTLFKPAALALTGLLRNEPEVSRALLNKWASVDACFAATLAARKRGRPVDARAAGAVALDMRTSKRFGSTSTPSNQPRWLE
jgi:hypothetical protein